MKKRIKEMHGRGLSDREISEALGLQCHNVTVKRREMGLSPNYGQIRIGLAFGAETT